jgi:cytochrome c-type biogenesis protein CcmF
LMLSKRRKYGGYVVHLAVAVMFFGFGGKAYDRMVDRTIEKPAPTAYSSEPAKDDKSTFAFGRYTFAYENLIHTSDDSKDAVTAQVSIWMGNEFIGRVYPAKWDYHKGEEATTEVAIRVRATEDVYVVLTGYDLDSNLANFRVFINPLISWVWIGFLLLALGTLICLIPQSLVDAMTVSRPKSRLGRAGEISILLLVVGGLMGAVASQAHAQGEHVPAGGGMGESGTGWAAMNRPDSSTSERAMKELLCMCGCARESIFDCKCQPAAASRQKVLDFLKQVDPATGKPMFDMSTESGREAAYNAVLGDFVAFYGGENVLATPRSKFSWLFPTFAAIGGLGLIFVVGRRWVARGKKSVAEQTAASKNVVEDEAYADKLDDELAKTD